MIVAEQDNVTPSSDRPLVTFALFAYNQEQFIREAVLGAFSQTYEPLEIILSDDCSTDRTYEIMCEMAREYQGPHNVIVRQSPRNRGVLRHVHEVASICNGDFIVTAAGDDISMAHRVETIARHLHTSDAVFTAYHEINVDGKITRWDVKPDLYYGDDSWIIKLFEDESKDATPFYSILGSTAAYRMRTLKWLSDAIVATRECPEHVIIGEDVVLSALCYIYDGKVSFVPAATVKYRRHSDAMTFSDAESENSTVAQVRNQLKRERRWSAARKFIYESLYGVEKHARVWGSLVKKEDVIVDSVFSGLWLNYPRLFLPALLICFRRKTYWKLLPSIVGITISSRVIFFVDRFKRKFKRELKNG